MFKHKLIFFLCIGFCALKAQENQSQTLLKVRELIEKKAEYHKITGGEQDGYRLKIHFGIDRENAKLIRTKFQQKFSEIASYEEYQQPNFVVLVGDFKTKLEAFELLKKIQGDFQNSFIVRCKVRLR